MKFRIDEKRKISKISPMIYGQFIEHFHRQIYGGIYDPDSKFADEDGFRMDVLEAMRRIQIPILRWPGGCFVSAYHWKDGVGNEREAMFDKAWRVEEPNDFGTDEYISLCRKLGCEPYICTNAGTGSAEEMSDWVEYCNLRQGKYALWRKKNGHPEPYQVKYWSIGNENYGHWEIGAKTAGEWGRLVTESAKMMKRVDPGTELSAAALTDMDWNMEILKNCGERLSWISLHGYWDFHHGENRLADYEECMCFTEDLEKPVRQIHGLLSAMGLEKSIRIAYDEWNLRAWYHPNIMDLYQGASPEEYLYPRDDNDINAQYTMADAVFAACFLNMCIRNSGIVGMANFSPIVNTRGLIYTHPEGIVLRSTYYVFEAYTSLMEAYYIDGYTPYEQTECETENETALFRVKGQNVQSLDIAASSDEEGKRISVAIVNKHPKQEFSVEIEVREECKSMRLSSVNGPDKDSYNDIHREEIRLLKGSWKKVSGKAVSVTVNPHSVNILQMII